MADERVAADACVSGEPSADASLVSAPSGARKTAGTSETSGGTRMPLLFVGHGSPMNAIERNRYSEGWVRMGKRLAGLPRRPRAILAVSAHWMTDGFKVRTAPKNKQVNDMYGFPQALYDVHYEPLGDPVLARRVMELAGGSVAPDNSWGIDHGVWTPLVRMFPQADVPVVMLSVAPRLSPRAHFELGRALRPLRDDGVLVVASGNVVHSFQFASPREDAALPWAQRFDARVRDAVTTGDWDTPCDLRALGPDARKAFQTPEHYLPLPAALGFAWEGERAEVWNEGCTMG